MQKHCTHVSGGSRARNMMGVGHLSLLLLTVQGVPQYSGHYDGDIDQGMLDVSCACYFTSLLSEIVGHLWSRARHGQVREHRRGMD